MNENTNSNSQPSTEQTSAPRTNYASVTSTQPTHAPGAQIPSVTGGNGKPPTARTDIVAGLKHQPVSEYHAPLNQSYRKPMSPAVSKTDSLADPKSGRSQKPRNRMRRETKNIDDFFTGTQTMKTSEAKTPAYNPSKPFSDSTAKPKLRIIPLGGVEEYGKNMTVIEYGKDIMIVDMGLMFPDEDMLGIDYVIPDVSYLEDKKDRIRGVVITHGHLDHIGGIPYLIGKLGFPTMYAAPLTVKLVEKRLEEFGLLGKAPLETVQIGKDVMQFGIFKVETFRLAHSIPDAMGLAIQTPEGSIFYTTDWKLDHTPSDGRPTDLKRIAQLSVEQPLVLLNETTNIERPGHSISEREIEKNMIDIFENNNQGRIIVATFASLISRIQQVMNAAHKTGRKVALAGRSMVGNVEAAVSIEAIKLPPNTLIDINEISKYADDKICVISTGSQGEEMSALFRMASGEHRQIKVKKGDTIVLSSSPIPGNEKSVSSVMDSLTRQGAKVLYNKILDIHTSGHAYQEDLKLMYALVGAKHLIPIHGERHKLVLHGQIVHSMGLPSDRVLIADDGQVVEFSEGVGSVSEERVPAGYVMVDGLGIGDVGNIVLRDRRVMAEDGIFVLILTVDHATGKMVTSPDIISRGFIYMRENEDLVHAARAEVRKHFTRHTEGRTFDANFFKNDIRDRLGEFLYQKTQRRPMVVPVVIEV